ncbi:indolepyruvate oxidoreductase subunit beta [Inmirania thermothiophila]|uniref:Indolepyruvate ferredoxin oxidoreductase beta subunit n=1 Tax=Inmirania thermothiophila TaxID=1750597 RepID=A0A3N1Y740_9GAMM|nr:indolepyruvate oxidoreductase subunit beta [Inmirania thermothiophila]ROR34341.1 indolepyruvate ferredoxin oxidoreductase beta subunit [Inmirania thermothiophila]
MSRVTNVLVCGTGGQGVMTAAEVLAEAAMAAGLDVRKTEVAGMAQRGGVVTSHVRFGARVLAPAIAPGTAHVLLAFEAAEAVRWAGHLAADGIAIVNTLRLAPPVVSSGLYSYPEDPLRLLEEAGVRHFAFDAGEVARGLGDLRLANTVMLGAAADHLPLAPELLREAVLARFRARKPALVEANARAFDAGRRLAAADRAVGA